MIAKTYRAIIFVVSFIQLNNVLSQNNGYLRDLGTAKNGFEKIISDSLNNVIAIGWYVDTIDKSREFPLGLDYPFIAKLNSNTRVLLRTPFSSYVSFGPLNINSDNILQLNDSVYAVSFLRVDTGQLYKSSTNWMVLFNKSGDTISTHRLKTDSNFAIIKSCYLKDENAFIMLGNDTAFYGSSYVGGSLYKIDINGNVVWKRKLYRDCGTSYFSMLPKKDGSLLLAGNLLVRSTSLSICRSRHYLQNIETTNGIILSDKVIFDSLGNYHDESLTSADLLGNGNVVAMSIPINLYNGDPQGVEFWKLYTDSLELLSFNKSAEIIKRKKVSSLPFINKDFYQYYYSISALRKEGLILLGTFCDKKTPVGNIKDAHYGFSLVRLDNDLEGKWIRNYYFDPSYFRSYIQSYAETNDDSLIFVGFNQKSIDLGGKGWVLKTDTFGCVVTGCQLHDAIQEIKPFREKLTLFPNPTKDRITIQLSNLELALNTELLLINNEGKVLLKKANSLGEKTITLNISEYPVGIYYALLKHNGMLLDSVKFAKE